MSNKHDAQELERQADAILAAAEAEETPSEPAPPRVMTDEEAKKAGIIRLDDKQVAALPAASWLINNEKLRELLAKSKKRGKLESAELMDAVDDLNLEGEQMDQLYDSLEALNIDISAEEDLLAELPEEEREIAAAEALEYEKAKRELAGKNAEIDRRSKIANLYCKAFEKAIMLEVSEENVRIWTDCCRMRENEIADNAKEAREIAGYFIEIAEIIEDKILPSGYFEEEGDDDDDVEYLGFTE